MGCWQCLPLSVVQLKGKHCQKPHCGMTFNDHQMTVWWHWDECLMMVWSTSDGRLMTIVSWLSSDDHWLITVVVWFISNFVRFGKQKKNSRTKPKNCRHFIVSIPILIIPWIPILSWTLASYDPGLLLWILIRFLNWILAGATKVILEKSRGRRFLWNRNWDLDWIWARWHYWKKKIWAD